MKPYRNFLLTAVVAAITLASCNPKTIKEPVDYVNPYIGNISHLLVPTFPTVQLPNSMLRIYPERADYTSELLNGLPIIVTNHRERSAFKLSVTQDDELRPVMPVTYDREHLTPYSFDVDLADGEISAKYAVSHQSAIYQIDYHGDGPAYLLLSTGGGAINVEEGTVSGYQNLDGKTKVYVYMEVQEKPQSSGILRDGAISKAHSDEGKDVCAVLSFKEKTLHIRYGVSFISQEQACANMRRELKDYDVQALAAQGRRTWNETLGRIAVTGGSEDEKEVFYTSYYRTFERPICMSEDGRYYSAYDGQIHQDGGTPFYTDDWVWDTYRAAHPLRILMDRKIEEDVVNSYLLMAQQMGNMWMPTFPEVTGDSRRMNSNHGVAIVADAIVKGLEVDAKKAYETCMKGVTEKTLAPWSGASAGWIDRFYWSNGYIPALAEGEKENDPNVHPFEKRQPVAVTLGTAYDCWCLSRIAAAVDDKEAAAYFLEKSLNYRTLFNPATGFFHPKDKQGRWIEPFDYKFSGGMGAREYYGENNGWVYRWDVQHNIADLVTLMGGPAQFIANLDRTFTEPLGRGKYEFYAKIPDHTGNVGQFSMANEPSLHIPYLYNYAGAPWKAQKRIRQMLKTWFRNDLMGMPGDEDGGGMTSFVVFSSLGIYPVTPGMPVYNIGSPLFEDSKINLSNGRVFEIVAEDVSEDNKYIQSATLNGKEWNKPWISHEDVISGGKLVLKMGGRPNKQWGADSVPPSLKDIN